MPICHREAMAKELQESLGDIFSWEPNKTSCLTVFQFDPSELYVNPTERIFTKTV
jgi:hypothetical protein